MAKTGDLTWPPPGTSHGHGQLSSGKLCRAGCEKGGCEHDGDDYGGDEHRDSFRVVMSDGERWAPRFGEDSLMRGEVYRSFALVPASSGCVGVVGQGGGLCLSGAGEVLSGNASHIR